MHLFTRITRSALIAACAGALALGGAALTSAQDSTSASIAGVPLINADGLQIGTVMASESNGSVTFTVIGSNLPSGELGAHIHETGTCDPAEGFKSAGGHFNPFGTTHGPGEATVVAQIQEPEEGAATPVAESTPVVAEASPVAGESHAGDLGNVPVDEDGRLSVTITTSTVTLIPGSDISLDDADGSAFVIHAGHDDLHTDPSGDSGDRLACAVLFPSDAAPASPAAVLPGSRS